LCEDLWLGLENLTQIVRITGKVRRQHLDTDARIELTNLADGLGVQPCTLVGQTPVTVA
jgi:hypothetical protein